MIVADIRTRLLRLPFTDPPRWSAGYDRPRELVVVIQALVILFTGALDNMVWMPLERLFLALRKGDA